MTSQDIFTYVSGLEAQVTSLQNQLTLSQATVATLQSQLTPISIPDKSGLLAYEKKFDNCWLINGKTGSTVSVIKDLIGNKDLIGTKPLTIIDNNWLVFENYPALAYKSAPMANPVKLPFTVVFVRRKLPGQDYEAYSIGGDAGAASNGVYVGQAGGYMRVMDPSVISKTPVPKDYITVIEQITVNANLTADYYQNGVKMFTQPITANNALKYYHSIGVDTNNMNIDFTAMYFKQGTIDTTSIYPDLIKKWGAGSLPNQILLANIRWSNNNGVYTPSCDVIQGNHKGYNYKWYWCNPLNGGWDYGNQTMFSTASSVKTSDFPGGMGLRIEIQPINQDGSTWRYLSGVYALSSQPYAKE